MQKDSESLARTRLKNLRLSHKLKQVQVTENGGFKLDSNYRYYETKYKFEYLPTKIEAQIIRAFLGYGTPPIEKHEILSLFHPQKIVAALCPHQINRVFLQPDSTQSGNITPEVETVGDSFGVDTLISKAFPPLTRDETELLIEEGQVMKGHGVRYGQIIPMEDEAMVPDLPYGIRVLCDPTAELKNGCYVFAHMNKMPRLVCRKYSIVSQGCNDKVIRLVPLNDAFESYLIDRNMQGHIIGRVVFAFKSF